MPVCHYLSCIHYAHILCVYYDEKLLFFCVIDVENGHCDDFKRPEVSVTTSQ